jgi:hypothetical protein
MSNGEFQEHQIEIGPLTGLKGTISARFSEDENGLVPAQNVVSARETYYVQVQWNLTGELKHHICGTWQVKIDLESIGTAKEYTSECLKIPMDPCKEDDYIARFRLSPKDVEPDPCGTVYLVAVTLTSLDPCGNTGHIWGYCKGPSVMFVT